MAMRLTGWAMGAAFVCLAVAALAMPVIRSDFLKLVKAKPTSKLAGSQCTLCHKPNGTVLNPYGADLRKAMKAAKTRQLTAAVLSATAKLDSDRDGFSNEKEIKSDTLPGDPKSKPAK